MARTALVKLGLSLLGIVIAGLWGTARPAAAADQHYELAARISLSEGAVAAASWLDNDHYLTLMIAPDGAKVYRHGYTDSTRELFMSTGFIRKHICGDELLGRLGWTLSPSKHYLLFNWFTDGGSRQQALVDISAAPDFKLKRFSLPPGMQVSQMLFSPDDRYAVLTHDAVFGDCDVSLLVLDFTTGAELWRLNTGTLNFISSVWWGGAVLDSPRFNAAAKLHDGQFEPHTGLARVDLTNQSITYTSADSEISCGAEALWGQVTCLNTGATDGMPYLLEASINGRDRPVSIPLSAQPVEVQALPIPGLVLLSNTADWITNQLWMIDLLNGDKWLVDQDCAGFSVAADNKLLVRARTRIELCIYELSAGEPDRRTAVDGTRGT